VHRLRPDDVPPRDAVPEIAGYVAVAGRPFERVFKMGSQEPISPTSCRRPRADHGRKHDTGADMSQRHNLSTG